MNPNRLQAEIWETQVWLMLILGTILNYTGSIVLARFVFAWAAITFLGCILKLSYAHREDEE